MDSTEFISRLVDHLVQFGGPGDCPICGEDDNWSFGDIVKFSVLGESAWYPFVPCVCGKCGYTHWLNTSPIFSREEVDDIAKNGPPSEQISEEEAERLLQQAQEAGE